MHHNNLLANLRKFIDENLVVIDDGREPSPDDIRRVQGIQVYTVARHLRRVRGRLPSCDGPSSAVWPAAAEKRIEDACSRVAAIFNGDPRLPYPVHVRTRATERLSQEELVDMAVDAVVRGGLIPSCSSSLPSASRWGSMMACLEGQVGGQRPEDVSFLGRDVWETPRVARLGSNWR